MIINLCLLNLLLAFLEVNFSIPNSSDDDGVGMHYFAVMIPLSSAKEKTSSELLTYIRPMCFMQYEWKNEP